MNLWDLKTLDQRWSGSNSNKVVLYPLRAPELTPHHQVQFSVIFYAGSYFSAEGNSRCILSLDDSYARVVQKLLYDCFQFYTFFPINWNLIFNTIIYIYIYNKVI